MLHIGKQYEMADESHLIYLKIQAHLMAKLESQPCCSMLAVMLEAPARTVTDAQSNTDNVKVAGARRRSHTPLLRTCLTSDDRPRGEHRQDEAQRLVTSGLLAQCVIGARFISLD
jgi:hypothetical protein